MRTLAQQKARPDHHKKAKGWRYIVNLGRSPSTAIRGDTLSYSRDKLLIHLLTSYKLLFYLLFPDRNEWIYRQKGFSWNIECVIHLFGQSNFSIIILLSFSIYLDIK